MQNIAKVIPSALIAIIGAIILTSCAIPSSPTGGPPDRDPPQLITISPAPGTTNFSTNTLEFTFNEYINRQTLQRAFSIEPDLSIPYTIDWKRTSATIKFSQALPENTTLIFTLGTDLTDIRSNKLKEPIQFAISTGPTIAEGEAQVQVANYKDGKTQEGRSVFLFRLNELEEPIIDFDSLNSLNSLNSLKSQDPFQTRDPFQSFDPTSSPLYVSQTDTAGNAKFIALTDGFYRPIWVDDRNRSRFWEPDREPAQAFDISAIEIRDGKTQYASAALDTLSVPKLWVYQPDTTKPILQSVGVTSERRLRLRFNEPITLKPGIRLNLFTERDSAVSDSEASDSAVTKNPFTVAIPLYVLPEDSTIIVAQTVTNLPPDSIFSIGLFSWESEAPQPSINKSEWETYSIKDQSDNPAIISSATTFSGSTTSDQTEFEIISTSLDQNPFPTNRDSISITYSSLIDPEIAESSIQNRLSEILDSTLIIWDNQLFPLQEAVETGKIETSTENNRLIFKPGSLSLTWLLNPSPTIQLYDPIIKSRNALSPSFTDPEQFGDLELTITENHPEDSLKIANLILQLESKNGQIVWKTRLSSAESTITEEDPLTVQTPPLPQGTYILRYFVDANQDNLWNPGSVMEQIPPEFMDIIPAVEIVNGFTGELEIKIR